MINNNFYDLYKSYLDKYNKDKKESDLNSLNEIVVIKNNNLDHLLTCDSLYKSLISIETDICNTGPAYSFNIMHYYFWLFLSVVILFWGINRLVPIINKKTKDLEEKLLAEESNY